MSAEVKNGGETEIGKEHHEREKGPGNPDELELFPHQFPGVLPEHIGGGFLPVVGLDDPDAREPFPDDFRQIREGGLDGLVQVMHPPCEKPGCKYDNDHGHEDVQGEPDVDVGHETDGGGAENDGVDESHKAHPRGHSDTSDVVRGVSHEVSRSDPAEPAVGQGLKMSEEAVPKPFLHGPGQADEASTPHITEKAMIRVMRRMDRA